MTCDRDALPKKLSTGLSVSWLVAELTAAYERYASDVGVIVPDEPIYY